MLNRTVLQENEIVLVGFTVIRLVAAGVIHGWDGPVVTGLNECHASLLVVQEALCEPVSTRS